MTYTEAELKAKTVKDLKEIAKEIGAPAGGKKDELIAAILAVSGADGLDDGLGDAADDIIDEPAAAEPAAGSGAPAAAAEAAAPGKHASIVFALDKPQVTEKKANIVGIKTLSDAERAQLRAAKFGLAAKGGTSKPAAGGKAAAAAGGGISNAGGVGVGLEEEIKKLQRAQKFKKLDEKDEKKLQGLLKKLEAQKQKQQLALDKAELADPEKLKAREAKFGKVLTKTDSKNLKDPELMKKRAEKFKPQGLAAVTSEDDDARKKARLERFAKEKA